MTHTCKQKRFLGFKPKEKLCKVVKVVSVLLFLFYTDVHVVLKWIWRTDLPDCCLWTEDLIPRWITGHVLWSQNWMWGCQRCHHERAAAVCCCYLWSYSTTGSSSACGGEISGVVWNKQEPKDVQLRERDYNYDPVVCLGSTRCSIHQVSQAVIKRRHRPLFQNIQQTQKKLQRRTHPYLIQACGDKRWKWPCCEGLFTCKNKSSGEEGERCTFKSVKQEYVTGNQKTIDGLV